MSTYILGVSAFYHDSAACLIRDGYIVAAAQEERFTRKKFDARFPTHPIRYCLQEGGISLSDLKYFVFYDKPLIKFERLLETYVAFSPKGVKSFLAAMPVWLKEKLLLKSVVQNELVSLDGVKKTALPPILFGEHHESHAASAFYASPFKSAAILCMDGVGEWATTSAWSGEDNRIIPIWEIHFPHSIGLLYSAFTCYTGFKVNSGEYKVMGLAPYGEPRYVELILSDLIDLKDDGSFRLNPRYFDFAGGLRMTSRRFHRLLGGPPRAPEAGARAGTRLHAGGVPGPRVLGRRHRALPRSARRRRHAVPGVRAPRGRLGAALTRGCSVMITGADGVRVAGPLSQEHPGRP